MSSQLPKTVSVVEFNHADGYPISLQGLTQSDYLCALFIHSARLYPLAPGYLQSQLNELRGSCRRQKLNHLALGCLLFSQHRQAGKALHQTLALLANHHLYQHAAEFISRALINNGYLEQQRAALAEPTEQTPPWSLPFSLHDNIRPVPATLIRALLQWPDNDRLFQQALTRLQRQSALAALVCRYATSYTPQGKQLALKPSLLLLGPHRSRELVLLAHFESNLSKPVFPIRGTLLKRRALIQHTLHRLAHTYAVSLPCRAELMAWLLVYDAWRSRLWTSQSRVPSPGLRQPWLVSSWLGDRTQHTSVPHRIALRLCQYWRLPTAVGDALRLAHSDPKVNALIALSISSVYVIEHASNIHLQNADHHRFYDCLHGWLADLSPSSETPVLTGYVEAVSSAASEAHYSSELPASMRP